MKILKKIEVQKRLKAKVEKIRKILKAEDTAGPEDKERKKDP
jgi:hypothetical protein